METLVERNLSRAHVDLAIRSIADCDESVGLFDACTEYAARTMQLEASSHKPYPVGQERGGERIARVSGVPSPVERESEQSCAIDQRLAR